MSRVRLLSRVPQVYVAPAARGALAGEKGVLLGAKRPQWVDVIDVDARVGAGWKALVERRFRQAAHWEAVGLSLPFAEFHKLGERLLVELVPGDVLVTEHGPWVHLGDMWRDAKLARG